MASPTSREGRAGTELQLELRRAAADFELGAYIELTREQLDRCVASGESPWPDESLG